MQPVLRIEPSHRPCLALAIEEAAFRASLTRAFERRGFAVMLLSDASELWTVPMRSMPSGAIVDIPDGVVLARKLVEILPSLPIVLLSGYESRARALVAVCLGKVALRRKPLDAEDLLAALSVSSH